MLAIFYTFYSIDYVVSRNFFFYLISYLIIFFLVVQVVSPKEVGTLAVVVVGLGIITSLYGLYQYLWGFRAIIGKIGEAGLVDTAPLMEEISGRLEGGRIFSTFLLPSHFAAFLGMTIPVGMAFVLTHKGWMRYVFGLAVAVQLLALYLTKSFSGWLSLIIACGCFAFIYLGYVKRVKARYLIACLGALLLTLALIFAVLSITRHDNPLASIRNNPMMLRTLNWGVTIDMIKNQPWLGKGLDTFGLIYPSYQRGDVNVVHHAHNTYLQLGVEMGIIGTMIFLWFAFWWFWHMVRIVKATKDRKLRVWTGALTIAGMAFFIHHAFDFEFYLPSVSLAGFTVLALAIAVQNKDKVYKIAIKKNRRSLFTVAGFIVVIVASLLLLIPFYGQMYFQKAKGLLNADRPYFAERSPFVNEAAAKLKRAILLDPHDSEYHHQYGALLAQKFSRAQEGIVEVQEAIQLSPWRHYYHFDLGMLYLGTGERDKGLEEIKKASKLYPLNEDYHQWLRFIYLKMGRKDLASQEEQWIEKIWEGNVR